MMTAELFYHLLNEKYSVTQYGQVVKNDALLLPLFYSRGAGLQAGRVYIVRTQDLPAASDAACIFVCLGSRPTRVWNNWAGEVLHISDQGLDILTLFNSVQELFERVSGWISKMDALADSNAELSEFVRASIPIFNNCIAITDYDLRILVNCDVREEWGRKEIFISDHYDRIPDYVGIAIKNAHPQNQILRTPFTAHGQLENPDGENYCINIFFGDDYAGTCALMNRMRPLHPSDLLLFQQFADYIRRAFSGWSRMAPTQFISIKAVFSELLQCFPVNREDLDWALELMQRNLTVQKRQFGCWHCLAVRSADNRKSLPEGYLCTSLENMLPHASAVSYNGTIACLCMVPAGMDCKEVVCDVLEPYLKSMDFRAGISTPFQDILKSKSYHEQALAVLDTGFSFQPDRLIYRFEDQVLSYMLVHCVGGFDPNMLLTRGLAELRGSDSGVDYWATLRCYLDNECNATHTAQKLFLHRSTLLLRLEKLKTLVDLDTPKQRLYLRCCIYLFDLLEEGRRKPPVQTGGTQEQYVKKTDNKN